MKKEIHINQENIFNHLKLSRQIPKILKEVVTYQIIASAAEDAGIEVQVEELQQAADNFRVASNLRSPRDTQLWLQKHYLSLDDFEALIYANKLSEKLAQHLFAAQVESFFYEHQLDYTGVVIHEVILKDEELAIEIFCALQEGEISFQEVARQYIAQPSFRRSGGYRGILHRQDLKPEISAAVFAAKPPQLLKPIVTATGVHLILVEEIIEPELDNELRSQILSDLFSAWLKQQMKQVKIVTHFESSQQLSKS
jgi:parvulin-like peptidyl-prolyl isomerase